MVDEGGQARRGQAARARRIVKVQGVDVGEHRTQPLSTKRLSKILKNVVLENDSFNFVLKARLLLTKNVNCTICTNV
jgi:hypothetical protein